MALRRREKTNVHIRRRHDLLGAGLGENGKTRDGIGDGHQYAAVKRFLDAVVTRLAQHFDFAVTLVESDDFHLQSLEDRNFFDARQNGLLKFSRNHVIQFIPAKLF
jgi:hypothetical protein